MITRFIYVLFDLGWTRNNGDMVKNILIFVLHVKSNHLQLRPHAVRMAVWVCGCLRACEFLTLYDLKSPINQASLWEQSLNVLPLGNRMQNKDVAIIMNKSKDLFHPTLSPTSSHFIPFSTAYVVNNLSSDVFIYLCTQIEICSCFQRGGPGFLQESHCSNILHWRCSKKIRIKKLVTSLKYLLWSTFFYLYFICFTLNSITR